MNTELYYIPQNFEVGEEIALPVSESRHILNVLRKKAGAQVHLTNGSNQWAIGSLKLAPKKSAVIEIIKVNPIPKPAPQLIMAFGLFRHPRMEIMIEKCTELGVSRFVPLNTQYVSHPGFKTDRMEKITIAAMKQSLTYRKPEIMPPMALDQFITTIATLPQSLILYGDPGPSAHKVSELSGITSFDQIIMLIGPEGGFSEDEFKMMNTIQAHPVVLSTGRLRSETAAITIVSQVVAHLL